MNTTARGSHPGVTLFIRSAGAFVIFISLLGLSRWVFETQAMQGTLPTTPAAKVNGLICGLCFGIILLLITFPGTVARPTMPLSCRGFLRRNARQIVRPTMLSAQAAAFPRSSPVNYRSAFAQAGRVRSG